MGRYRVKRKLSDKTKRKIGDSVRKKLSLESVKLKMREAKIGFKPWNTGKNLSSAHKKKLSDAKMGSRNPWYGIGMNKGKKLSDAHKKKISESLKMSRPHLSDAHIQKLRECMLGKGFPNFNPRACQIIDEYGKKYGYNFQHALNGGEIPVIGYSLDGYDKVKNVVIEYYEKRHHSRPDEILRDSIRKERIIKHLGCEFIELKEE